VLVPFQEADMGITLLQLGRRAGRIAGLALVAICLLTLLALGLGPRTGAYRTLTVLSASMRPTLPEGSVIVVTPLPLGKVRVGDVITYHIPVDDRRVVSHRVVEVVEGGHHPVVRTKGDANPAPDPWLARLDTEPAWRVRAAVPKLGYLIQSLRRPPLASLATGLVPALLALIWLTEIWFPGRRRTDRTIAGHRASTASGGIASP
ncbi:MAG: signal peptidase I, partial [Actinomycetota bacterium]|nr:signal peptidase I [Actinomycetota bacterium]